MDKQKLTVTLIVEVVEELAKLLYENAYYCTSNPQILFIGPTRVFYIYFLSTACTSSFEEVRISRRRVSHNSHVKKYLLTKTK